MDTQRTSAAALNLKSLLKGGVLRISARQSHFSLCLFAILIAFSPVCLSATSTQTLDAVVDKLADDLADKGGLADKSLLIRPGDLFELGTEHSLPLAKIIQERLVLAFSRSGARLLYPGVQAAPEYLLQGQWHTSEDALTLTLKLVHFGTEALEIVATASGNIDLASIPRRRLTPDLATWSRYLVRKLELQATGRSDMNVHLAPFKARDVANPEALGEYLADWLRPALGESLVFQPIDVPKTLDKLNTDTLRDRSKSISGAGGQQLSRKQFEDDRMSLTGALVAAQAELVGKTYLGPDALEVRVHIRDAKGLQIAAAETRLARHLLPARLLIAKGSLRDDNPISRNGLGLELSTTHGEGRAVYAAGERIRFVLRANRNAHLYLINRDSSGRAAMLYPLPGAPTEPLRAGEPLILPDDGLPYELVVQPPFGQEQVWAVASEKPLELPPMSHEQWQNFIAIRKNLREQHPNSSYAEAALNLVTQP